MNLALVLFEAIWAGSTISDGRQPQVSKTLKVFIAADEPLRDNQPHENAIGNHLGIWDFYFIKKNEDKLSKFYHQHFLKIPGLRLTINGMVFGDLNI